MGFFAWLKLKAKVPVPIQSDTPEQDMASPGDNREAPVFCIDSEEDLHREQLLAALYLKADGKIEEALVILRRIVRENERHITAWYALAEIFTVRNELGRAFYCYEQILRWKPQRKASEKVGELHPLIRSRPDYLWEYNKERGMIK